MIIEREGVKFYAPVTNDRVAKVPYVVQKVLTPSSNVASAYTYSVVTNNGPFKIVIAKAGYNTLTMSDDLSSAIKTKITLQTMDVTNEI